MADPEWTEAAHLANEIIDQLNPICNAIYRKASTARIGISALSAACTAMAHQAAGLALMAADRGEGTEAYNNVLRHIDGLIKYRHDESIAHARKNRAEQRGEAVH